MEKIKIEEKIREIFLALENLSLYDYAGLKPTIFCHITKNFDIEKLSFYYECFDVIFDWADYEIEEHRITLRYDGKAIEETECDSESGSFEQLWSLYEDDDEDDD